MHFVLLISISSEISILSYSSIYTNIHLRKLVDSIYPLFQKQIFQKQKIIINRRSFSILFNGKSSSELNLIFM